MECLRNPKRNEILHAAAKLFAKNGFERTRIDEIAALANVGKGTIYLYFENKEQIFQMMILEGMTEMYRQMNLIISGSGEYGDRLKTVIEKYLELFVKNKDFFQIFLDQSGLRVLNGRANLEIRKAYQRVYLLLEDYFNDGIRHCYFRSGNARHYTLALTGMIQCIARDWAKEDQRTRSYDVADILNIFLSGVRNPAFEPTQKNTHRSHE